MNEKRRKKNEASIMGQCGRKENAGQGKKLLRRAAQNIGSMSSEKGKLGGV
jgi:hypothetical protein